MTSQLNPYIAFRDNAREALEFYQSVFGGELNISTFGDMGNAEEGIGHLVMHGDLQTDKGYRLMAADTMPGMDFENGARVAVSVFGDDSEALRGYFDKLSAAGSVSVPFEKQMWGDEFGMCTDQFGISWMVNVTQSQG
jgi:PhnB protein